MRRSLLTTIVQKTDRECCMRNSPQSLAARSAQFTSDYQVTRLRIKMHPIRFREVPCLENFLNLEGKAVGNSRRKITVRDGCRLEARGVFVESFAPSLHIL